MLGKTYVLRLKVADGVNYRREWITVVDRKILMGDCD